MDKVETALTATEDNAAAIRALNNKLNAQAEKLERLVESSRNTVIYSAAHPFGSTFGEVESDGNRCVLFLFNDETKCRIIFCGKPLINTTSPILMKLPEGRGELITTATTQARVVIFAPNTVYKKL